MTKHTSPSAAQSRLLQPCNLQLLQLCAASYPSQSTHQQSPTASFSSLQPEPHSDSVSAPTFSQLLLLKAFWAEVRHVLVFFSNPDLRGDLTLQGCGCETYERIMWAGWLICGCRDSTIISMQEICSANKISPQHCASHAAAIVSDPSCSSCGLQSGLEDPGCHCQPLWQLHPAGRFHMFAVLDPRSAWYSCKQLEGNTWFGCSHRPVAYRCELKHRWAWQLIYVLLPLTGLVHLCLHTGVIYVKRLENLAVKALH